jgi:hypothetical protein
LRRVVTWKRTASLGSGGLEALWICALERASRYGVPIDAALAVGPKWGGRCGGGGQGQTGAWKMVVLRVR